MLLHSSVSTNNMMTHLWKLCQWLVVTKVYTTVMQTVGHSEHYVRPQVSNEIYTRLFLQGTFAFLQLLPHLK